MSSLMLIAIMLRVKGLGATNLWLDEANSWYVAQLPWGALLDDLRSSPVGPLYFVLLKLWMALFGDSEAALRAPSLIASVLVIPITYTIGVRVFTRRAATLGALLLTLSPLQLYFAQEARMYMPLTLLATLYLLAYLSWRDATSAPETSTRAVDPDLRSRATGTGAGSGALVWYVIAGTVMVYTNIISATLIAAINLDAFWLLAQRSWRGRREVEHHAAAGGAAVGHERRGGTRRAASMWIAANAAITIAFLLYLLTVRLRFAGASQGWRAALGAAESLRAFFEYPLTALHGVYYYARDFSAAAVELQRSRSIPAFLHFVELFLVQPLTLIVVVLAIGTGVGRVFRGSRRAVLLAVAVPLTIGIFVSASRQLDLTRYFLFATPFLFLIIGYGLTRMAELSGTVSSGVSLAILVLTMAFGIRGYGRVEARDSDYRPVVAALAHQRGAASVILVKPGQPAQPLFYYLRDDRTVPVRTVPRIVPIPWVLPSQPRTRAWLVLDYRSRLYGDSPDALRDQVGARVLSDRYFAGSGGGVRLVLLETS